MPTSALVLIGDKSYVFVESAPWTFERRAVEPAERAERRQHHQAGLKAGDRDRRQRRGAPPMIARFVAACLHRRWLVARGLHPDRRVRLLLVDRRCRSRPIPTSPTPRRRSSRSIPGTRPRRSRSRSPSRSSASSTACPGLHVMRSRSTFGLSLITLVFRDGVEDYWARQRIRERISERRSARRARQPGLDPLTSPIGEIYRYTLESPTRASQRELKELQQWVVIPDAQAGVRRRRRHELRRRDDAVSSCCSIPRGSRNTTCRSTQVVDAIQIEQRQRRRQRHRARRSGLRRARHRPHPHARRPRQHRRRRSTDGHAGLLEEPRHARSSARSQRNGILGKDDNPDGVSGIVLLLRGVNPSMRARRRPRRRSTTLNHGLLAARRAGRAVPRSHRARPHDAAHGLAHAARGHGPRRPRAHRCSSAARAARSSSRSRSRSSLLIAFILMRLTNIPANLLSLGAIDFGIIVDGAIVVLENILRAPRGAARPSRSRESDARDAATAGRAADVLRDDHHHHRVPAAVRLPARREEALHADGVHRRLRARRRRARWRSRSSPGSRSPCYAKPRQARSTTPCSRGSTRGYERVSRRRCCARPLARDRSRRRRRASLAVVLGVDRRQGVPARARRGLDLAAGAAAARACRSRRRARWPASCATRRASSREVTYIVTQLGRNDDGTDPWTPSHIECSVGLHAVRRRGRAARRKHDLISRLAKRYARIPGHHRRLLAADDRRRERQDRGRAQRARGQGLRRRFRRDAAHRRRRSSRVLEGMPGAADVAIDQEPPLPQLQIDVDREAAARFGINVADVARSDRGRHRRHAPSRSSSSASAATTSPCASSSSVRNSPEAIGNLTLDDGRRRAHSALAGRRRSQLRDRREHDHARDEPAPPHGEAEPARARPLVVPRRGAGAASRDDVQYDHDAVSSSRGAASSRTSSARRRGSR